MPSLKFININEDNHKLQYKQVDFFINLNKLQDLIGVFKVCFDPTFSYITPISNIPPIFNPSLNTSPR